MAALHGKGGSATFTGLTFELLSWSFNGTADVAESTVMGSSTKTYLPGYIDFTATCECVLPAGGMGVIGSVLGSAATLVLKHAAGGKMYTCTYTTAGTGAICTGMGATSSKDGVATCTYTFQGSSVLVEGAYA